MRRAATTLERAQRRYVADRPEAGAGRLRRAVREGSLPVRRSPPREVGPDRLGAGPWPAREDLADGSHGVGQPLHRELVALAGSQDPPPDAEGSRSGAGQGAVAGRRKAEFQLREELRWATSI